MKTFNYFKHCGFFLLLVLALAGAGSGQTTVFTYQGKLNDGATGANGNYELQFKVYDTQAVGTGTQIGGLVQNINANVVNGIFTVQLDFGANTFDGAERFLEIAVRRNAGESFVMLSPRQPLTSAPYAVKSRTAETAVTSNNTTQLGGVDASQYVQTSDPRMTDQRDPLAGSGNYIQNRTTEQLSANFNISGEGKASIFSADKQFNIGSSRILSNAGANNLFVGAGAGAVNTGGFNTFVGAAAGESNTTGQENTFVGRAAGRANTNAFGNSFFGRSAGLNTTTGEQNSFFGQEAGLSNSSARYNAFFGALAGRSNTTGEGNSFFGTSAGLTNTTGTVNSFFGLDAGRNNSTGGFNTFIGSASGHDNTTGHENTFVGRAAGFNNTIGFGNSFIGRSAGENNTDGDNNTFVGVSSGLTNTTGGNNTLLGNSSNVGSNNLTFATAIGAGSVVSTSSTIVLGRTNGADKVRIFGLGAVGSTPLCRNANNEIASCSPFPLADSGKGEIMQLIQAQQLRIEAQADKINLLMQLVCAENKAAAVCRERK